MAEGESKERFETTRMSLAEHLIELRKRLFRGVLALAIAFIAGWTYYQPISKYLLYPLVETTRKIDAEQVEKYEAILAADATVPRTTYFRSENPQERHLWPEYTIEVRPIVTGIGEGFFFSMRVAMMFAFAVGGPVLLYQLWQFIAAGLYPKERRMVLSYFPFSVLLFLGGVVFGAVTLIPYCMKYLAQAFPSEWIGAQYKLESYWDFYSTMTLALGGVFQLPVVMFALVHVDLIPRAGFARYRGHFI
ncbi:MAG TPA: twin-arginine translocase subunit TatC, partial [Planctomycetota bacterium]|nr:twin-arginine translocase subunit TatC [Planctomycetota bacterium]